MNNREVQKQKLWVNAYCTTLAREHSAYNARQEAKQALEEFDKAFPETNIHEKTKLDRVSPDPTNYNTSAYADDEIPF